jgi:hypothetical protein
MEFARSSPMSILMQSKSQHPAELRRTKQIGEMKRKSRRIKYTQLNFVIQFSTIVTLVAKEYAIVVSFQLVSIVTEKPGVEFSWL